MYKKGDAVKLTAQVLRRNPTTNEPETLNLSSESGMVKKVSKTKKESNYVYYVETQYGVHAVGESKLTK